MNCLPSAWLAAAKTLHALRLGGVIFLIFAPYFSLAIGAENTQLPELELQQGQTRVLSYTSVIRVAVGDGQVLNAVAADGRDVILFARKAGTSSIHIWTDDKVRHGYLVHVAPAGMQRMRQELDALLQRIPNARSTAVGDKFVIEGEDLTDADRARVAALAERYPAVLDFTGRLGWDRMVLLDVQVVEVPRSRLHELGIRWDSPSQGGLSTGLAWDIAASSRLKQRPGDSPLDIALRAAPAAGYFGMNALMSARINALAQTGEAVILAQPQLLARSGTTASFLAGGEVPYATVDPNGNASTVFKPYGVSLRITPQVDRRGTVRSRIEVEASSVDASVNAPGGPALKTRRASTEFNVRSGQTLVIGGFLSRERSHDLEGLPGLSRLPIIGSLFSTRRYQRKETELAIFVTPVVISQEETELRQRVNHGRAVLNQAFPEPSILGTTVPEQGSGSWNPYAGEGSQWQPSLLPDPSLTLEQSHHDGN
jgi:pilus assembly protein CpaC